MRYMAVFLSGEDKQSLKFSTVGDLMVSDRTIIQMDHEDMHIEIDYHGDDLYLKNNGSILHLNTKRSIQNQYMTAYGALDLKVKVESFDINEKRMKLKYGLYDTSLISSVYILITFNDVEEQILVN